MPLVQADDDSIELGIYADPLDILHEHVREVREFESDLVNI